MAQIAKGSGVLVGQIYRDFSSKEDIVAEIVERDLTAFLADDEWCSATRNCDSAAVRRWIAHFISADDKDSHTGAIVAEIMAESARNERIAAIFRSIHDRLRSRISSALEALAPDAAVQDRREILVEVILTVSAGMFQRRLGIGGANLDPRLTAAINQSLDREISRLIDA